jgi:hypothetical protein
LHSASEEESSRAARTDEDSDMEDAQHESDEDEEQPLISRVTEESIHQCSVTSGTQPEIPRARRLSAVQSDSVTGEGVLKWLQR